MHHLDNDDEDRVAEIFASDGLYLLEFNATSQLWRLTCVYTKCSRARGRRECEFIPKNTPAYASLLSTATRVQLAAIPSQFRTKRHESLVTVTSIAESVETHIDETPIQHTQVNVPNIASPSIGTNSIGNPPVSMSDTAALQSSIDTSNSKVTALQSSLDSSNSRIASLQASLDLSASDVTALRCSLDISNARVTDLQGSLDASNSEVNALQGLLDASKSEVTTLKRLLDASDSELITTRDSLCAVSSEVTALRVSLEAANSEITNTQASLDAAKSEAAALQASIGASNAEVAALHGSIDISNAEVAALRDLIDTSNAEVTDPRGPFADAQVQVDITPGEVGQSCEDIEKDALCAELNQWRADHAAIRDEVEEYRLSLHEICKICKVDMCDDGCLETCVKALQKISGAHDVLCFVLQSSTDAQQCVAQLYLDN